jgi:Holliday junction resolvase-like predicted endonuclease
MTHKPERAQAVLVPLAGDWLEKPVDADAAARNQAHESLAMQGRNIIGQNWTDDKGHHLDVIAIDRDDETVTGIMVVHADDLTDGHPLSAVTDESRAAAAEALAAYLESEDPGWKPPTRIDYVAVIDKGAKGTMQVELMRGRLS